jgi:hypothetical protein
MRHPAKAATPATAVFGLVVHVSVAPAGVVNASVTGAELDGTVLPPRSATASTGWAAKFVLRAVLVGLVVNRSLTAGPTEIVNAELAALASPGDVAVSV